MKRKVASTGLTVGTALGSAALMYQLYPASMVFISMAALIAHEYGHYLAALMHDGAPDHPVFIPLIIGSIGLTRVRNLPNLPARTKRYIILAGPTAGAMSALFMLPFAIMSGNPVLLWGVLLAMAWEIYNGTLGSDGKRWKEAT